MNGPERAWKYCLKDDANAWTLMDICVMSMLGSEENQNDILNENYISNMFYSLYVRVLDSTSQVKEQSLALPKSATNLLSLK